MELSYFFALVALAALIGFLITYIRYKNEEKGQTDTASL